MKYLRSFYKRHRGMAALALLLLLGQVVGTLLIPALIANVVDLGILPGNMDAILRTGGQMLAVALLSAAVAAAGSWVTADLGARFGFEMRSLLLRKSQELSLHQFDEVGVSSMITRTTSDITNLQQTMGMVLQMVVPAPLIVGASIVMTAMVTPVMAVIQVGFMAALAAVAAVVLRKSNALSRSIQVRLDRINRVVREAVTGVRVIRAFGNEAYEEARSGDAYRSYADNMIRLNRLFAVAIPVVWMLMGALMAVVLWAGGVLTLGGGMEVGQITAVTEYSILTMGYLLMAVSVLTTLPKARACLARLTALLDTRPDVEDGAASDTVRPSAADLRREAGQMRGFHSQSCRFGGENAAEAAEVQRYVNRKEVRDRRNEKTETIRGRARPGAWHGLNCTSRCRSTASCWPCATRWGCARRRHSGTCACCGCGRWTMRRTATYPPCRQGSWRRSASSASAGPATSRWRCARPGLWTRTGGCTTGATTLAA